MVWGTVTARASVEVVLVDSLSNERITDAAVMVLEAGQNTVSN